MFLKHKTKPLSSKQKSALVQFDVPGVKLQAQLRQILVLSQKTISKVKYKHILLPSPSKQHTERSS